jgi:hypothetical protein
MKKNARRPVITVTPGDQPDLTKAQKLCDAMKGNRAYDCRQAGTRLAVILKEGTTSQQRRSIIAAFVALGYETMQQVQAVQGVVIVRTNGQHTLEDAGILCKDIKDGRVLDCEMKDDPPSLSIILQENTKDEEIAFIAEPFDKLGYKLG